MLKRSFFLLCLSSACTFAGGSWAETATSAPVAPAVSETTTEVLALPDTVSAATSQAIAASLRPQGRDSYLPNARWGNDGRSALWTRVVQSSLRAHASNLPTITPADIQDWCPAYSKASVKQREAFWIGLVSTLVKHESTYRPTAVGGGDLWYGLMQIFPSTARLYKCNARSGGALKHGPSNLACGLRIMSKTVARDQVVSRKMRGVAADWGPFHSRKKRTDMMAWTRKQPYCKPLGTLRPTARPADFQTDISAG